MPRDVATRAIHKVVYEFGLGIDGQPMVYLDLTHIDRATLDRKLGGILEIYEKFVGVDPHDEPMKIFPGMHYTMGGLWVDFNQMTNIPGIFAAGECEYQYHGANRLGANSLVSCIFGGFHAGPNALELRQEPAPRPKAMAAQPPRSRARPRSTSSLINNQGTENPFKLWRELGADHDRARHRHPLQQGPEAGRRKDRRAARSLQEGEPERQEPVGQHQLRLRAPALQHAGALADRRQGAILRDESRGAHYKPDFPERNDEKFLKTTKASFTGEPCGPQLRVRRSRHAVHQAAPAPLRRSEVDGEDFVGHEWKAGVSSPTSSRSQKDGALAPESEIMANKTVQFEIKRQASPDAPAVWEKFELEWRPGMNVISAMMEIAANPVTADGRPTTPITYDSNCLEEICGSCAMRINGKARMACSALVDNLEQPISVEPLSKFPLVRDLQVDRSVLFENLKAVKAWVPVDGTYDLGSGPRVFPQQQEANYPLSNCISLHLLHGSLPAVQ